MLAGVFTSDRPFLRTPKFESRCGLLKGLFMAGQETMVAVFLWVSILGLAWKYGFGNGDVTLWMTILAVQSVPYLAALLMSLVNALPKATPRELFNAIRLRIPVHRPNGQALS
jgi:hypothetical protein